jgi:hypothetical protein
MRTQHITATFSNGQQRIETGPLQINDDWTGTFIRGDNSGYYGLILSNLIKDLPEDFKRQHMFNVAALEGLAEVLSGSREF